MADSPFPTPPTWPTPQPISRVRTASGPPSMPLSWVFDPRTGDLATDGAGRVLVASPRMAATQAAAFLVSVQRGRYTRIFSRNFGVDLEGVLALGLPRSRMEPIIAQRMRASAQTDARIQDLTDFGFDWSGQTMTVRYTLVLADGTQIRQEADLW